MTQPVLITGCSSGIGLATARFLANNGVAVYATVRSDADAERVEAIDGVETFLCDVTSDEDVARLRHDVEARGTGLWGLVHNAGISHLGLPTTTPLNDLRTVFDVNVFGVHRVTNAMADLIVDSGGRIVMISSIYGTLVSALGAAYAMSKHAIEAYTDALAAELGPRGVRVSAIAPGEFASDIGTNVGRRFEPPPGSSEELVAVYRSAEVLARPGLPSPEPVAEACHAALFDAEPLERYLVVSNEREADAVLGKAARNWSRLNASMSHGWSVERLAREVTT